MSSLQPDGTIRTDEPRAAFAADVERMDPHGRRERLESALAVVRFFGIVAAFGWASFVLLGAASLLGASGSHAVFALHFVLLASGGLSVPGALIGVAWAGPRAGWALGRPGFWWFGCTAVLAVACLLWPRWLFLTGWSTSG